LRRLAGAALLALLLLLCGAARADPIRVLVAVSHARGSDGEPALQHSTEDADSVRDVLTSLGGVGSGAAIRLVDPSVAAFQTGIDRARAVAATHPPAEVTFVLYFSGHGDRDRIHLGAETIPIAELLERARAVPAALRIVVTDACRNDPTRSKGLVTEPAFALSDQRAAADGVVWLSASETGEAAQESDTLRGALFTHFWVSGLRGAADANGDGRVTLAESYDFAYSQTLFRSASGSGVLQHPTATFALSEFSPIVLTQTFGVATRMELPLGTDVRYLVFAVGSRRVLGELWSHPDHAIAFAVPPGRYVVERRSARGDTAATELALGRGDDRTLTAADFRPVPEEQMAAKGGEVVLRPSELALELGGGVSRLADGEGTVGLRYARVLGDWALSVGPRAAYGLQHTSASDVRVASVGLDAALERRWRLGGPILSVGAGAAVDFVSQRVQRTDAAVVAAAGYPTTQSYGAVAPGPIVFARLRVPVGTIPWIEMSARGELLLPELDGRVSPVWTGVGSVGTGFSF
jgi:hypothetical protein